MTATVAEQVADWCATEGGGVAFVVPGLLVDPLIQALHRHPAVHVVTCAHEAGAGYAADGFSRERRGPCAVVVSGGPGLTNLLTSMKASRLAGSPVLVISGDVPASSHGSGVFQDGTHPFDDADLGTLVVGRSTRAKGIADITALLQSMSTERAPAHLILGVDVQERPAGRHAQEARDDAPADVIAVRDRFTRQLAHVKRPLFAVGAAAHSVQSDLVRLASEGAAIATTPSGFDLIPAHLPGAVGVVGEGGDPALADALRLRPPDTLITLGTSWDHREGGARTPWTASADTVIQFREPQPDLLAGVSVPGDHEWGLSSGNRVVEDDTPLVGLVEQLGAILEAPRRLVVDAGSARAAVLAGWRVKDGDRVHYSLEQAPMGWSLGAAIGIALATRCRPIVLVGDGSALMHGTELSTIAAERLDVGVILIDNGGYDTVGRRMDPPLRRAVADIGPVDWPAFARSLGVEAQAADVTRLDQAQLRWLVAPGVPRLLSVKVPRSPAVGAYRWGEVPV